MLYLVATPIGNLKDITLRGLEVLKSVDFILCEDTRRTLQLLHHYQIQTPVKSYDQHTEKTKADWIIQELKLEKNIALVSDAGTPAVSDPGALLVDRCHQENIRVESIVGASSVICAYSLLGTMRPFQFLGFFPKKGAEQKEIFEKVCFYDGVSIFFESPQRILKTLKLFDENCKVTIFRELTKKFEERIAGSPKEVIYQLEGKEVLGELVVAIESFKQNLGLEKAIGFAKKLVQEHQISINIAAKIAADIYEEKKQDIYNSLIEND